MREVETRSLSNTTSPAWQQSFHMPIEDVSHVLRIIALHDAQKGAASCPAPCLHPCHIPAFYHDGWQLVDCA